MRDLRGHVFGGYRLIEPIATGGMGQIFLAEPAGREAGSAPGPPAAVKVLHGFAALPNQEARFEREARAALRLRHPNIVKAWEFGRAPDGTLFLVMEHLRGLNLRIHIERRGVLTPGEAVRVARGAGAALAFAHAQGVVHRDLKPDNVFLCEPDGLDDLEGEARQAARRSWTVKLLDFGLALLADDSVRLTHVGTTMGTPSYMSPEQVRGQHEESPSTDVWGLGAVLYHALSGRAPFDAETAFAEMVRVLTDEPVPLDAVRTDLPESLVAMVTRALTKEAPGRFATIAEMVEALPEVTFDTDPNLPALGRAEETRPAVAGALDQAAPAPAPEARVPLAPLLSGGAPLPALLDEVRLVSVVVADGLVDARPFTAAMSAQHGHTEVLAGGRAVGLFGGRAWEGDEPQRAVAAGLQVCVAAPQARIGVGTGRAERRTGEHPGGLLGAGVTGAAVASAERAATVGAVGLDDDTARRVRGGFSIVQLGGGRQAASAAKPQVGVIGIRGVGGREIATVGRTREVARLTGALEAALRDRTAHAVLVVGPQGIGKSRLRYELEVAVEERPERIGYLRGIGEPSGAGAWSTYGAFAHALRRRAGIALGVPRSVARERLSALMRSAIPDPGQADEAAVFVGEILGANSTPTPSLLAARADAALMQGQVRAAIERYVRALAVQRPLVVTMEDLQWVDPASLELLERLPRMLAAYPLLVLGTARPETLVDYPDLLGADAEKIVLGPLDLAGTRALLRALLERDPPDPLATRLHALSGGNPYFIEELALHLRARGADAASLSSADLPSTVQGAVQSRMDRLLPEEKELLKQAAVYGARFWQEGLAALGSPDAQDALARLRRRELLAPPADAIGADGGLHEWAFRDPIVREVAYGMLTDLQRRRLHAAAAGWIAGRFEDRPAEVALHLEAAGTPDEAGPYWALATERAIRRGDATEALALSARGLARPSVPPALILRLSLAREQTFAFLGRRDDQEGELERAESVLGADGVPPEAQVDVAFRWARLLRATGRLTAALETVDRALLLAHDGATRARLLGERSALETHAGRADEGSVWADRALAAAEACNDAAALSTALQARALASARQGDLGTALDAFGRAATVLESIGDIRGAMSARMNIASGWSRLGRFAQARDALKRIADDARAIGHAQAQGFALVNLGFARWRAQPDDAAAAFRDLDEALAIARTAKLPRMWIGALLYRATIALEQGDVEGARARAEEAKQMAAGIKEGMEAEARTVLGAAALMAGDVRAALAEGVAAMSLRERSGGMEEFETNLFLLMADALSTLGDDAQAQDVLAQGRAVLLARADRISDPEARRELLTSHPAHRALLMRTGGLPKDT